MTIALTGARIFDGSHMLDGRAVVIENGRIRALPRRRISAPASNGGR